MANPLTKKKRRVADFKQVLLGSEEGKRVLAEIYRMCGVNKQTFDPNNPHVTSYNAGLARVSQGIASILAHSEQDTLETVKYLDQIESDISQYDVYKSTKGN